MNRPHNSSSRSRNNSGEKIAKNLHDALKLSNCIQFTPPSETFEILKNSFFKESILGNGMKAFPKIGDIGNLKINFQNALGKSLKDFDFSVLRDWNSRLEVALKSFSNWGEIEAMQKISAQELGKRGWFLSAWDSPLSLFPTLLKLIRKNQWSEAEEMLLRHFNEIASNIEVRLKREFPKRQEVLAEAFSLHRDKKYFGSIAILISQSEGIGRDIFSASPMSRKIEVQRSIKTWIEKHDPFSGIGFLADLIFDDLPIHRNSKKLESDSVELNRHLIMHGLSANYGTILNSTKAISWIEFIASFNPDPFPETE